VGEGRVGSEAVQQENAGHGLPQRADGDARARERGLVQLDADHGLTLSTPFTWGCCDSCARCFTRVPIIRRTSMSRPADILLTAACHHGERIALIADDARYTFDDLERMSARVAAALAARGAGPGTVVSLFAPNRWEWLVAYHGALRAGCVVNPINGMLTAEEM